MVRIGTVAARARRAWSEWDRGQRRSVVSMVAAVVALHLIGWGVLVLLVAPGGYTVQGAAFGVGLGATAYTLGMRHAFDADHIAAIDNTTRKLVAEKKKPMSVGFWFSLGHSTVVFAIVALVAIGIRALAAGVENPDSGLQRWTGVFGTGVSGTFLILIGLLNLVSLVGIWRVLRRMRQGEYDERALEQQLDSRGALTRFLGPLLRAVRSPWQMYPIGLLFGLGFDTVTEVSLLVLAGGAAATDLPWYAIIVLPVLFSAGMSLFDSLDGAYMNYAYGWAFAEPVRKIYYNVVVTGLSVTVALLIGAQEIISILADKLDIAAGPLAWIGNLDLGAMGFIIVALFVGTWAVAVAVWRYGDVERRWRAGLHSAATNSEAPP
ncbi:HoxN/HupN/NixA family nickel/cobalt transporter [Nocardia spumae]|uniref:HoxN/HupN/NixA family nickel/cobalt transporter n=1 Tax=Nocardia spumae TaxID=2887190 RepID=UPI001D1330ED|nr:HoxN/HupN/NixA family nickel/cobalt transporter [Nocardia spumae]